MRRQADLLWTTSLVCIILVCAVHISLAVSTLALWSFRVPEIHTESAPAKTTAAAKEPMLAWQILNAALISIAISALAARALEQGAQREREKERYRQYESALEDVLGRFVRTRSQIQKLWIMEEMKRLSYREIRDFLICGDEALFVM